MYQRYTKIAVSIMGYHTILIHTSSELLQPASTPHPSHLKDILSGCRKKNFQNVRPGCYRCSLKSWLVFVLCPFLYRPWALLLVYVLYTVGVSHWLLFDNISALIIHKKKKDARGSSLLAMLSPRRDKNKLLPFQFNFIFYFYHFIF